LAGKGMIWAPSSLFREMRRGVRRGSEGGRGSLQVGVLGVGSRKGEAGLPWARIMPVRDRMRLGSLAAASGTASRGGSSAAKHKEKHFLSLPGRGGVYVCTKVFDHLRSIVGTREWYQDNPA
jgi:hypothetical protein